MLSMPQAAGDGFRTATGPECGHFLPTFYLSNHSGFGGVILDCYWSTWSINKTQPYSCLYVGSVSSPLLGDVYHKAHVTLTPGGTRARSSSKITPQDHSSQV